MLAEQWVHSHSLTHVLLGMGGSSLRHCYSVAYPALEGTDALLYTELLFLTSTISKPDLREWGHAMGKFRADG